MAVVAFAQEETERELLDRLKNANNKEKIKLNNKLARLKMYDDPQMAIKYAEKALQAAVRMEDKRGKAEAYNNLGLCYYFADEYELLRDYYRKSLSEYRSIGDNQSISNLSSTYFRLNQSEKALKNYKQSLLLYIDEKNWEKMGETYKNMADVYKNITDYSKALYYYREALKIVERERGDASKGEVIRLLDQIGQIYFFQNEYDTALVYFTRMKQMLEERGDNQNVSIVLSNIANSYYSKGDFIKAQAFYKKALKMQIEHNSHWEAAMSLMRIGMIEAQRNKYELAIVNYNKSVRLAKVAEANELLRDNYLVLSEAYEALGNYRKAYHYRIQYSDLSEAMVMDENIANFANVLSAKAVEEKQRENEILQTKNKNILLELEKENLVRWRLSFGFTIIIMALSVFIIYYRYYLKGQENKNLEQRIAEALKKQEEQQQIIMHQSSLTSLGELAAGIAHEINQPVQNISLSAESIKYELEEEKVDHGFLNKSVNEIFEDIVRVRQIVDHIRIFSSGQKDEVEEEFDVSECVRAAASMIGNQYANHHIQLSMTLSNNLPCVLGNPHKLEQVIHNLLSNAKDAVEERKALQSDLKMQVKIETYNKNEQVYLRIIDNGVGISQNRKTDIFLPFVTSKQLGKGTGLGLSISYSLIKEMRGHIEVESEKDKGTAMVVILPLAENL
ncbi:tetratricopeptide repeat-containing sensor histidine kinase [Carboxylicivirga marina]|uniref:histidine kinase n=1 Tax=Carboxylicivirga marina TaxID=2800988 RepID=A0ABS1HIC2_9BACT|nr:tetratricopeptide repeat-containing sensor histidine kinase [Carboxylicivirga marina]MBK3517394.1 tetratricopeptide repeat-containing sensor histidine kinase [Carboxylicivirga marina]